MNHKAHLLSKLDLFSELTLQDLELLAGDFQWEEFTHGSDIISQGQLKNCFYMLIEGKAEVLIHKPGRDPLKIDSFIPGDAFGEVYLITGNPADVTVRCTEDCKVLALDAEHFAQMLVRWPKLYHTFLAKLSKQLRMVNVGLWESKYKEFLRSSLQLNQLQSKFYGLWGSSRTTSQVENQLNELALAGEHLLLVGERGTGRQMFAWFLHKRLFGEAAPFIVVDGRHFDEQWGDVILDPHGPEDNTSDIKFSNLLDIAAGGTLFIRELNLLSPRAQLKLSAALQSLQGQSLVIGCLEADPELLPQRLLPQLEEEFTSRHKINPLRNRKRDIAPIAEGVLERLSRQYNRKNITLDQDATKLLLAHNYRQGNVTELIQVIERAFFLAEDEIIGLEHVFFGPPAKKIGRSVNLLSFPLVEKLVRKGIFPLWLQRFSAVVTVCLILLMLAAPQANLTAFLFVMVWSLWWPSITILSPFIGRFWCAICPTSYIMETVQKRFHLNRPVPNLLKKYDYLFITFLYLFIFWLEAITGMRSVPVYTGLWLACIVFSATVIGIIYQRHTWCRHLCPLGAFVGMASIGGMLEVRSDTSLCLNKCTSYECYRGRNGVPGCPMSQHVPFVDNNLDCKLCLYCARNCPNGAVQLNLRIPAREVWHLVRVNQGFAIFIGVALAILAPILYFEPLFHVWPLQKWILWFSLTYWITAMAAGLLTWLISRPYRTKAASRRIKLVFALIPLALGGYMIYQLRFLPGARSLFVGLGLRSPSGLTRGFYVPALQVEQAAAALFGLAVSGFTLLMVLLRNKKPKPLSEAQGNLKKAAD